MTEPGHVTSAAGPGSHVEVVEAGRRPERGVLGWARAIALGIRDTAQDMLDEGRQGAREAYEDGWRRYDNKTRYRSKRRR